MTAGDVALVLAAVVVLGGLAWWLTARASRLDRLHVRVETTRAALDAALLRRAAATEALAASGALDPASALLLASAAAEATAPLDAPMERVEREVAESDLSRALRAVLTPGAVQELHDRRDEVVEELLADLSTACDRVVLARRFANDSVVAARRVRRGAVVRLAHLAGHAPLPRTFDVDDEPPALGPRAGHRRGARAAGQEGAA
ncbi:NUDIX hydrolase [Quadrisphaera sp. INWT6]|uniref:NUDIX hydrolase n=1 Tax=Quadrisphaera sp. INWT6 TaxID=2596917 RepID=UPI0019D62449|nr:NUDIX hydrolase [Quadrisphaera sp. INWT6]MBF5083718.1 hypothetical protein [Quadrisphaera sp. INWT6]